MLPCVSSCLQVPFSDFVNQVKKNEVNRVIVDSSVNNLVYSLRPSSATLKKIPSG